MMKVENDIQVQQIGILSMIDNNEMFKTKNYKKFLFVQLHSSIKFIIRKNKIEKC